MTLLDKIKALESFLKKKYILPPMNPGKAIKELRNWKKCSLEELANNTRIEYNVLERIENGKKELTKTEFQKIKRYFSISEKYFMHLSKVSDKNYF